MTDAVTRRRFRWWPLWSAAAAFGLTAALALVIVFRESNKPFGFEAEWMDEVLEHRSEFWTVPALVFNTLGGGLIASFVVPIAVAVVLLLRRRRWAAIYFLSATLVCAVLVRVIKLVVGRPRPPDILVSVDPGSFPSGHSANAAIIAIALGVILNRWWVWAAGAVYTIAMMLSRTYLGAHWISDTIGGVLIAGGVAVAIWAPFAARMRQEART
jgi:undecaprenyl-diphosphatase